MDSLLNWQFDWHEQRLLVQPFDHDHLDAIYQIERESHSNPWKKEHFESSVKHNKQYCLAAQLDGNIKAYAIISVVVDEAELLLFVVNKKYQHRGLGVAFLNALLDRLALYVKRCFLEVRQSNIGARSLYEKVGFNEISVRSNYYPAAPGSSRQREDAVIYAMDFSF